LCKAARAGRRAGSIVVVDVRARWHLWAGRDPRAIRSILREADVVRCSTDDLAVLGVDAAFVQASMRKDAVLLTSNGQLWASGPFGEIARRRPGSSMPFHSTSDPLIVSICAALVRAGVVSEDRAELWERALDGAAARSDGL